MSCSNNLRQWILAVHNYHDANQTIPTVALWYRANNDIASWRVGLLPFIEQQGLFDMIMTGGTACSTNGTTNFPAGLGTISGSSLTIYRNDYVPAISTFPILTCASDPNRNRLIAGSFLAPVNYRACYGDNIHSWLGSPHTGSANSNSMDSIWNSYMPCLLGAFRVRLGRNFNEFVDGTSNTIFIGECLISPVTNPTADPPTTSSARSSVVGPNMTTQPAIAGAYSGDRLAAGRTGYALQGRGWINRDFFDSIFHTIMPPNTISGFGYGAGQNANTCQFNAFLTASSYHTGGVNVAKGDAAVKFVNNSINCGNPGTTDVWHRLEGHVNAFQTVPSPFGVWGAMGTVNCGENASID
jgi:hypothetical protein